MNKKNISFTVFMVATTVMTWCGFTFAAGKEPVKIGLVTSISGPFSPYGVEIQRTILFAVKQANQEGGVDGRKVEVMQADDESTPEGARRGAEKVSRAGHNLIIGPISTPMSLSIAQKLESWDALYIAVTAKSDKLRGDGCNPRMFSTTHGDAMDVVMMGNWLKSVKEKKFSIIAADYAFGRDSAKGLRKIAAEQGKEIKLELFVPVGTKDFAPYLSQLAASGSDAVWVTIIGRDGIAFAKQAAEFGLKKKMRIIGHSFIYENIITATGDATEGYWGNIQYDAAGKTKNNQKFVAAWKKEFNREPTTAEGQTYFGLETLFYGIKAAGSVKPEAVAKAISGATFNTIYGQVKMRGEDHQMLLTNYIGQVKNVGGKYRPVIEKTYDLSIIPPPSGACRMK